MPEPSPEFNIERLQALADELEQMQTTKNDGRGVGCVQTIVAYLRLGNMSKAMAVCYNEGDKIRSYPDIARWLELNVVGGPWLDSFRNKIQKGQSGE